MSLRGDVVNSCFEKAAPDYPRTRTPLTFPRHALTNRPMTRAVLTLDLDAVAANWRALAKHAPGATTGAVVKADAYGLGAAPVAQRLAREGARDFFVALAEEGAAVRAALGDGPRIFVFSGHMEGDGALLRDHELIPLLNSPEQVRRQFDALPTAPFGVQLDSAMNRLGLEPEEWSSLRGELEARGPALVMSHLACADMPDHEMNPRQLANFTAMTDGTSAPRSLAATGGVLLGSSYHFEITRPGVGLYGGLPFAQAQPVVQLRVPVVQIREIAAGESVGYAQGWVAPTARRIATLGAGYADGLIRAAGSGGGVALVNGQRCPMVGRVSMDMIALDVTAVAGEISHAVLLGDGLGVDDLASAAGTIGYEILTSLGARYERRYIG